MTKVIRVKDRTFETLIAEGKWTDTMDDIISRLLQANFKDQIKNKNSLGDKKPFSELKRL